MKLPRLQNVNIPVLFCDGGDGHHTIDVNATYNQKDIDYTLCMVSVHRQDEKVTSPLLADKETTETKQKLPRMIQNCYLSLFTRMYQETTRKNEQH